MDTPPTLLAARRGRLVDVPAGAIRFSAKNPRTDGGDDLEGLAASLAYGMAQRPTVVEVAPGVYEVLYGERRVRAACANAWATIPCLVLDEAPDPLSAHLMRLVENLNRKDLGALDEAAALQLGWYIQNARALGAEDAVAEALTSAATVHEAAETVLAVLVEAGYQPTHPNVTQEAFLTSLGLGLSAAALRKKIQTLTLDASLHEQVRTAGLTAAAIRSLMRLEPDEQAALLAAVAEEPLLARRVRSIVEGVKTKGRSLADAIAVAGGRAGPAPSPAPSSVGRAVIAHAAAAGDDGTEAPAQLATAAQVSPAPPAAAAPAADLAALAQQLAALAEQFFDTAEAMLQATRGAGVRGIPAPHSDIARDALQLTVETLARLKVR